MDNLKELQRRRALLKAKIEQQRFELKNTFLEVREEIEPSFLLKKAVQGLLHAPKGQPKDAGLLRVLEWLPFPFLLDLFIKDRKLSAALKVLAPLVLKFIPTLLPGNASGASEKKSTKETLYSTARKGVTTLRKQLKKTEKEVESPLELTEN